MIHRHLSSAHKAALMRVRAIAGIAMLITCFLPAPASAEGRVVYITGNELLDMCREQQLLCEGYILGVADALEATSWPSPRSCRPKSVLANQVLDVALGVLVDNPAERHRPAFDLIADEVVKLWPC